jgi:hypothetical protein
MNREIVRFILTEDLNIQEVCAKITLKNLSGKQKENNSFIFFSRTNGKSELFFKNAMTCSKDMDLVMCSSMVQMSEPT